MLIKIIRGTYGLNIGGNIKPKICNDEPFDVPFEEAQRLIGMGIAEGYSPSGNANPYADGVIDGENGGNIILEENEDNSGIPEYNEDNTNAELQAIAKEYGVELPPRANKAEIIAALDEYFGGVPIISAKEPE